MKRVSFEVAKALKEAGYPQECGLWYSQDGREFSYTEEYSDCYARPTYLEVWLWLWREKKICINCNLDKYNLIPQWWCNNEDGINYNTPNFDDPEEAIVATIEGLVENNLIK